MRRRAHLARAWALLVFAVIASAEPALAQDAAPDAMTGPRASTPPGERVRLGPGSLRRRVLDQAPPSFVRHAQGLRPFQRRVLERRLRRMPESQRQRVFRDWERMSLRERDQVVESFIRGVEGRRRRELPLRLRTPEMRERLLRMTPEERSAFFARAEEWRGMDAGERTRMRARLAKFGELSEPEQQALIDAKFARKSPEERARILHDLREASQQTRGQRGSRD